MISAIGWICFAPIFNMIQYVYDVNLLTVNYMSLSFAFFFLPMNFPSTYVLDRYGLRVGVMWGITLTVLGLWLRCLVNQSFWWVVAGQTVMAIGQPFLYNAPSKVTGNWFDQGQRSTATMIGNNANVFGQLLGFLLPGFLITPKF